MNLGLVKRSVGWGLSAINWQGWIITLFLILIIILDILIFIKLL